MKKSSIWHLLSFCVFVIAICLAFSACSSDIAKIEDFEWKMRTVMKNDSDLVVPAVGEADEAYPNARIVDLTLLAKKGKITIIDATNNIKYEGSYTTEGTNPKGTDYKVTIDGKEGYATVAMTTYDNGRKEPTLPINLGDYSIYFYAESSNN